MSRSADQSSKSSSFGLDHLPPPTPNSSNSIASRKKKKIKTKHDDEKIKRTDKIVATIRLGFVSSFSRY